MRDPYDTPDPSARGAAMLGAARPREGSVPPRPEPAPIVVPRKWVTADGAEHPFRGMYVLGDDPDTGGEAWLAIEPDPAKAAPSPEALAAFQRFLRSKMMRLDDESAATASYNGITVADFEPGGKMAEAVAPTRIGYCICWRAPSGAEGRGTAFASRAHAQSNCDEMNRRSDGLEDPYGDPPGVFFQNPIHHWVEEITVPADYVFAEDRIAAAIARPVPRPTPIVELAGDGVWDDTRALQQLVDRGGGELR